MKQKLQVLLVAAVFSTSALIAQNKVWDFGNDQTNFPANSNLIPEPDDVIEEVTVDGLTFNSGGSNPFGEITDKPLSAGKFADDPTYSTLQRLDNNKAAGGTAFLPNKKFMSFPVTGPVHVKLWFRDQDDSVGSIWVTDGTSEVFHFDAGNTKDYMVIEGNYTGGAGTLYVFSLDTGFHYLKIETTTTTLGTDALESPVSTNVKALGDRIYVSNVKMTSEINLYNPTGALVKSFETNEDIDFGFNPGLYIARIKTAEGEKSVKILLQ
tara:strand:- start:1907 stop:2707 length:801 start_codon:yes stop_codon:yes gene_type:complete